MSLRNNQNRGSPEACLPACRVKDRDLAVVLSGSQAIDAKAEAERHRSQPAGGTRNNRRGRGFKDLVAAEIKADKGEKRLAHGWAALERRLIGLEVDVYLVTRAEDSSHARNQFLAVFNQGVDRYFLLLVRTFLGVIECFLEIDALAAEHDRANRDALVLLVQVGNHEGGLVGADSARLIVARQELDH